MEFSYRLGKVQWAKSPYVLMISWLKMSNYMWLDFIANVAYRIMAVTMKGTLVQGWLILFE